MEMKDIIKSNRLRLKLTQGELGEIVGVNKAAVQKWESGKVTNLKNEIIVNLARIFGISISELYAKPTQEDFDKQDKDFRQGNAEKDLPRVEEKSQRKLRLVSRLDNTQLSEKEEQLVLDYMDFLIAQRKKNKKVDSTEV